MLVKKGHVTFNFTGGSSAWASQEDSDTNVWVREQVEDAVLQGKNIYFEFAFASKDLACKRYKPPIRFCQENANEN